MSKEEEYMQFFSKFHTVVLLDELCTLAIASSRKFSFDICYRMDAIRKLIIQRSLESSADKH